MADNSACMGWDRNLIRRPVGGVGFDSHERWCHAGNPVAVMLGSCAGLVAHIAAKAEASSKATCSPGGACTRWFESFTVMVAISLACALVWHKVKGTWYADAVRRLNAEIRFEDLRAERPLTRSFLTLQDYDTSWY